MRWLEIVLTSLGSQFYPNENEEEPSIRVCQREKKKNSKGDLWGKLMKQRWRGENKPQKNGVSSWNPGLEKLGNLRKDSRVYSQRANKLKGIC